MDYRGNMSGQHRRSKVNHSVILGPELTQAQDNLKKKKKALKKMTLEELAEWRKICDLHAEYWKNRQNYRRAWMESGKKTDEEINKRVAK